MGNSVKLFKSNRPEHNGKITMEQIGDWEVLCEVGKSADGHKLYDAKCVRCGFIRKNVKLSNLKRNNVGDKCRHPVCIKWANDRLRCIYNNMKWRCYNEKAKDYRYYGQRGIRVCDMWLKKPETFFEWALSSGYNEHMTIDRIDCNGCYCPENCRWIDRNKNAKLKRTTRLLTVGGITDSISGIAKIHNIPKTTLVQAVRNKSDESAIDYIKKHSRIVQREECLTVNQEVVGAEPTAGAKDSDGDAHFPRARFGVHSPE